MNCRIAAALLLSAATAACSGTPSYYSDRVGDRTAVRAAASAEDGRITGRRTRAERRRTTPAQVAAQPSVASAQAAVPARAVAGENTGAAPQSTDQSKEARERRAQLLAEERERALKRSLNSICRGC